MGSKEVDSEPGGSGEGVLIWGLLYCLLPAPPPPARRRGPGEEWWESGLKLLAKLEKGLSGGLVKLRAAAGGGCADVAEKGCFVEVVETGGGTSVLGASPPKSSPGIFDGSITCLIPLKFSPPSLVIDGQEEEPDRA